MPNRHHEELIAAVDQVLTYARILPLRNTAAITEISTTVDECRRLLHRPPTILVTGRMKGGKSTLINALVRQCIAETAILECTDAVTVYTKGAPQRIENIAVNSEHGNLFGRVKVHYLPSESLSRASFVDTPGLGTIDANNREIVDALRSLARTPWSRDGNAIDGLIYVFDSTLRADELAHLRSLGFPTLASLGVLSRADDFGAGAFGSIDSIDAARQRAADLSKDYAQYFASVVPVSGLMAETAETGAVDESLAATLGTADWVDRETLMHDLEAEHPVNFTEPVRENLLRVLGAYGVLNGRDSAAQGAAHLQRFLRDKSGIASLTDELASTISYATALRRAGQVRERLHSLAFAQEIPRLLDLWHEGLTTNQRLSVELFDLLRDAPGNRVSAESIAFAEEVLRSFFGVGEQTRSTEIHDAASARLLDLVSPLEEKILTVVVALCGNTAE